MILVLVLMAMSVPGENTPPEVDVHTPEEGSALGLSVTVSGKATDVEGFDIESYVEARWNDWEWFLLPNTPADGGASIVFGEMVNLDWHAPGEHLLQVRAFDGELFSDVALVNVTVRDLPDLVIQPWGISLVNYVEGDESFRLGVVVGNQGGEEIPDVQVRLFIDGVERDSELIDVIAGDSERTVVFKRDIEPGAHDIQVSARSLQTDEEKSLENNDAERTFTFAEPEDGKRGVGWGLLGVVLALVVILIWLGIFVGYRSVIARKD